MCIAKITGSAPLYRIFAMMGCLLVFRVTAGMLLNYRDYFPPNFESDFLRGREHYFSGSYRLAFYAHIVTGPVSLILGMILVRESFRLNHRIWHRYLGLLQSICVLFLVSPSGLWMAYYVDTGIVAAIGFGTLSVVTGACIALGWRSGVKRRFADHRRWMWRCFLLLCSAVVLRLMVGLASVTHIGEELAYPIAAWASWLMPLIAFELMEFRNQQIRIKLTRKVQIS